MGIYKPIDAEYPKVMPLTQALITAAAEQGASAEDFKMASDRVIALLQKKASGILLSELQSEA